MPQSIQTDSLPLIDAAKETTIDTVASDSLSAVIADPFEATHCHEPESPRPLTHDYYTLGVVPFTQGLPVLPRPKLPGYDTGVMCLLLLTFLFLSANFRHYSTFVKTFAQDLWKVRNRSNIFDDHTLSETRVQASFILLLCVSEGILMYCAIAPHLSSGASIFSCVAICTGVAIFYYAAQLVAYRAVGYTFTTAQRASEWIKGFRASQSLLGITLVVPALVVLFNPGIAPAVIAIGMSLYVLARIIFILKGFRIFYINSFSLVYFILYLCALEILPPYVLARAAYNLSLLFD